MLLKMLLLLWNRLLIATATFLLLCHFGTDGFVLQLTKVCFFSDTQNMTDMEFQYVFTFNKQRFLYFNQTAGEFMQPTPPTGYADWLTDYFNNQTEMVEQLSVEVNTTCERNMIEYWNGTVSKKAKPSASIASILPQTSMYSTRLVCHIDGFYPQSINVTWYRNGNEVINSVNNTVLSNGDWTYQVQSYVEFTPHIGDVYTCRVEHISSQEPLIVKWEPSLDSFQKYYIIVAAVIFVIGLVALFSGWIFWKSGVKPIVTAATQRKATTSPAEKIGKLPTDKDQSVNSQQHQAK